MFETPEHHKAIARHIVNTWQLRPQIKVWRAESGSSAKLAIGQLEDFPVAGATTFSTVGLSDFGGFEIVTTTASKNKSYVKAVYDVGSYVIDGNRRTEPGETFTKVLARYYTKSSVGHLFLTTTPLPGLKVDSLHLDSKVIKWLYAWPLTSDELIALDKEGVAAFDERLKRQKTQDILSLDRTNFSGIEPFDPWGAG